MADRYVFADEAGNFDFSGTPGASRYFILTSVTVADCSVGEQLLRCAGISGGVDCSSIDRLMPHMTHHTFAARS